MNEWAKTDERGGHGTFDRRVYRREFADALGYGITWFRRLEKCGAIPPGRRDPGGKRLWWLASEARATLIKLTQDAERVA